MIGHEFVLLGAPKSKKNNWAPGKNRFTGTSLMYQKDHTLKDYVQALRIQFLFQARKNGFEKIPSPLKVFISYKVYFKVKQNRMDRHNAWETVLDALQGVCYDDDLQVVGDFHPPVRLVDDARPRVELEVLPALDAEQDPRFR